MSTILKALRRLEDDASQQAEPQLRDRVVAPTAPPLSRGWKGWVLGSAVGFAAAVAGAVALWWVLPQSSPDRSETVPSSAVAPPAHASLPVLDLRPPSAALPSPPAEPASLAAKPDAHSPGDLGNDDWDEPAELDVTPVASPPPVAAPALVAEASVLGARLPDPAADAPVEAPSPAEPGATAARSVPIPEEIQVPTIVRSRLPRVAVLSTRWHPVKERRQAEVELPEEGRTVTVVEGDRVGPLRVSEITLSGVVFEHDGIEIQRRVGESASVD